MDEITLLPVLDTSEAPVYPIELRVTRNNLKKIVPLVQNTLCAMKFANNIAGLASMFGYNIQMNPDSLNDAQAFLKDIGDDDEVSTISKLYPKLDPRYAPSLHIHHSYLYGDHSLTHPQQSKSSRGYQSSPERDATGTTGTICAI